MAKTFKFGENGKWATKTGSSMAYNDQNGNFKPIPFSVTRDSIATRVNKQGLIEVVGKDKLRIDYKDSSNGVALLEPARTNILPYSTLAFNGGTKPTGYTVGFGTGTFSHEEVIYKGQFAVKHTQITTGRSYLDTGTLTLAAGTTYTFSMQVDLDNTNLNPSDEIISFIGFTNNVVKTFSDLDANGYLEFQFESGADNTGNIRIGLGVNGNMEGGKIITWSMPQLESGSYPTSYIPTSGSTYEREADVANGAGNEQVFNDSEGVLFANIASLSDTVSTYNSIGVGSGSTDNRIGLGFEPSSNIYVFKRTTASWITSTTKNIKLYNKIALSYNTNDNHFWLNGFKIASNTTIGDISQPNELGFEASYGLEQFYGKTKEIGVYDAVLTDAELEALTSYTSFTNMANELNLTIK